MVSNTDIAWLAGMIESEGSISFQTYLRKNGNICIVPFVRMTNTDVKIIKEFLRICEGINVKATDYMRVNLNKNIFSNKDCCNIRIEKMERVVNLINLIVPYMKSFKKKNASVVLSFIESRQKNLLNRDNLGRIIRSRYSKNEVELVASIRTHRRAMPLSEMLCAPNVEK